MRLSLLPQSLLFISLLSACPEGPLETPDAGPDRFEGYGEPLDAALDQWSYHEFAEAECGNGDPLGIGFYPSSTSNKVLFYLEGGGACWNAQTCNQNLADFVRTGVNEAALENFFFTNGTRSIFNRENAENPFKDFSFVYVPYCTGDVHSGSQDEDNAYGVRHSGYKNVTAFLNRVVPSLPDADEVFLAGVSAGGFGAVYNFAQVKEQFIDLPVHLLVDSAPPMTGNVVPQVLTDQQNAAWNTSASDPEFCTVEENNICTDGHLRFLAQLDDNPDSRVALIASTADQTLRFFFGLDTFPPNALTPAEYEAGLDELREILSTREQAKIYTVASEKHVYIRDEPLNSTVSGGVAITDFLQAFVDGTEAFENVQP